MPADGHADSATDAFDVTFDGDTVPAGRHRPRRSSRSEDGTGVDFVGDGTADGGFAVSGDTVSEHSASTSPSASPSRSSSGGTASDALAGGEAHDSNASITWTTLDDDAPLDGDDVDATPHEGSDTDADDASFSLAAVAKTILSTGIDGATNDDTEVVAGEFVTYRVVVDVPLGDSSDAAIVDVLDPGLVFDPSGHVLGLRHRRLHRRRLAAIRSTATTSTLLTTGLAGGFGSRRCRRRGQLPRPGRSVGSAGQRRARRHADRRARRHSATPPPPATCSSLVHRVPRLRRATPPTADRGTGARHHRRELRARQRRRSPTPTEATPPIDVAQRATVDAVTVREAQLSVIDNAIVDAGGTVVADPVFDAGDAVNHRLVDLARSPARPAPRSAPSTPRSPCLSRPSTATSPTSSPPSPTARARAPSPASSSRSGHPHPLPPRLRPRPRRDPDRHLRGHRHRRRPGFHHRHRHRLPLLGEPRRRRTGQPGERGDARHRSRRTPSRHPTPPPSPSATRC